MTQAFNLSQLANNVNTSGLLNAAAGLYNQTPVANGGTGVASVASGNLLVGAGTSAMTALAGAATNDVVTWDGSAWVSQPSQGSSTAPIMRVYTTPGTWTKPATVKAIKVTVVGGGGNGVSIPASPAPVSASAAGGGGGGTAIYNYAAPAIPGPQPYTVGTATNSSSFGVAPAIVITATGGSNGPNTPNAYPPGAGGSASNGQLNIGGQPGMWGQPGTRIGAPGGSSFMGGGGIGNVGPGGAGRNYGGGGAGAGQGGASAVSGGAGASGVVIVEEFY